uniref:Sieve element occlusion N-terminal domain-containing protein n=1 Tax=Fagus sylvatica TaxID=28930 RepID=A0A2N9IM46_FAGSY
MDSKVAPSSQQKPNVTNSVQQPSQVSNLLQSGQPLAPLQQTSNLAPFQPTNNPAGSYQQQPNPQANLGQSNLGSYQPNPQANLGSYQPNPQANLGSYQPNPQANLGQTNLGSYQPNPQGNLGSYQPNPQANLGLTNLGSYQPNPQTNVLGSFLQPNPQANVDSWHQPNPLGAYLQHQPKYLAPYAMHQLLKGDRGILALSDDSVMMNQVQATHFPDGREVDAKPLLRLVEDIFNRATLNPDFLFGTTSTKTQEKFDDKIIHEDLHIMLESVAYTIDRVACELTSKPLYGTDAHQTTLSIFHVLSIYGWDAKLVLALAAFSLIYGEFWLLAQIYSTNQLAKPMAILRQVPGIMEHATQLKTRLKALNDLINTILDVARCAIEIRELQSMYTTHESPHFAAVKNTFIPTAIYWTVRSMVACAAQITSFSSMGYDTETLSFNTEEKLDEEYYRLLVQYFYETINIDNVRPLKLLVYPKDDLHPLVDCLTKTRVNIDVLRRKSVLLLISNLDISLDELSILEQIYNHNKPQGLTSRLDSPFEVVWIPIVDRSIQWTDPMQRHFESLKSSMPWYSVHDPTYIGKASVRFIKEKWHFRNRPILVVIDPQGKVVSPNAIHMMWIWGGIAYPFTTMREADIWRDQRWTLDLVVDEIDQTIQSWIRDGKYIYLYGGDDIEWIRKFTKEARSVAIAASIPIEMIYVGKSNKKEVVKRLINTITTEKLSHFWQDQAIWFFWTRLESMLFSKIQLETDVERDIEMQEIKKLISHDKGTSGWSLLSRGSSVVVNGHGKTMLKTLLVYDSWKNTVNELGFDVAFRNAYNSLLHEESIPCSRFEFSHFAGKIPEDFKCPECGRHMEKYNSFLCCHDENAPPIFQ